MLLRKRGHKSTNLNFDDKRTRRVTVARVNMASFLSSQRVIVDTSLGVYLVRQTPLTGGSDGVLVLDGIRGTEDLEVVGLVVVVQVVPAWL